MTTQSADAQPPTPETGLTIGELARRTGVASTTLRMWESRYGFPSARRLASGHRRYDVSTVDQVATVLRRKDAGVGLAAAVAEVSARGPAAPSVFAELRRLHPHLAPYTLRKRTLTALTHAMEDECCARAQRPWLFGAFQRESFYRQAEPRWKDLASSAAGAWVFAEFDREEPDATPVEVPLPSSSVLRREWSLVCLSEDLPCCVSAWELPGQQQVPDGDRLFETLWSLDPVAVQDAARSCAAAATGLGVDMSDVTHALDVHGYPAGTELGRAAALFSRVVAYVDGSRQWS